MTHKLKILTLLTLISCAINAQKFVYDIDFLIENIYFILSILEQQLSLDYIVINIKMLVQDVINLKLILR